MISTFAVEVQYELQYQRHLDLFCLTCTTFVALDAHLPTTYHNKCTCNVSFDGITTIVVTKFNWHLKKNSNNLIFKPLILV